MALKDELAGSVRAIFRDQWETRDGQGVPKEEDLALGNDAVLLEATVLYADLAGSTRMVDTKKRSFAAEIYKAYLHCAARIIRSEVGTITAYDGDRIMAVFIGESKNTSAARAGLKIHYAVREIINPLMKKQYSVGDFNVRQVVGIDTSELWVARTGVRGPNDLVWVGRAANHAAKLTELDAEYPTWITQAVHERLQDNLKVTNGRDMWQRRSWTLMDGKTIYRSNWWWPIS